jgi:hypothetical protein
VAHHEQHFIDGRAIGHGVTSAFAVRSRVGRSGRAVARGVALYRNQFPRYVKHTLVK